MLKKRIITMITVFMIAIAGIVPVATAVAPVTVMAASTQANPMMVHTAHYLPATPAKLQVSKQEYSATKLEFGSKYVSASGGKYYVNARNLLKQMKAERIWVRGIKDINGVYRHFINNNKVALEIVCSSTRKVAVKVTDAVVVSGAQGKVTMKKVSGSKYLTVAKGTPCGRYQIKVAVTAAGNSNYAAKTTTAVATIEVSCLSRI